MDQKLESHDVFEINSSHSDSHNPSGVVHSAFKAEQKKLKNNPSLIPVNKLDIEMTREAAPK